jgi:ankyrin repeat protein
MEDAGICPISLECGLVHPRRSVEISRLQDADWHGKPSADSALGLKTSSSNTPGGTSKGSAPAGIATQQQLDAVHARMNVQGRSFAGSMSSETPAELLLPDGRLNMDAMMEHSGHGKSSQPGLGLGKIGSFRLSRTPSSKAGLAGAAPEAGRGPASARSASSCKPASSGGELPTPQLPEQLMQLTLACQMRDARLLQQLLAAGVRVGAALDVDGNTALHLVLLPVCNPAAVATMHDSVRSHDGVTQHHTQMQQQQQQRQVSSGGAFSWLTGCFTGSSSSGSSSSAARSTSFTEAPPLLSPLSPAAAASAQLTMVAALLAAGADTNARNRERLTPVMLAARQLAAAASSSQVTAAYKVLELLCKGGQLGKADLNLKDAAGRTALAHALLPAPSAVCMDRSTVSRAAAAAAGGSVRSEPAGAASAYQSAGYGASVHTTADASVSAKSAVVLGSAAAAAPHAAAAAAVAAARVRAVQLLVHHRADVNAADTDGMTPLMHAAAQPNVTKELLLKLLELGANSRLLDNKRRSALTHAMIAQQLRLMPALGPAGDKYRQQQRRSSCSCSQGSASVSAAGCTAVPGYYYAAVGSKCGSPASASSNAAPECAACAHINTSDAVINNSTSSPSQQQQVDADRHSSSLQAGVGRGEADNVNSSSAASSSSSSQDGGSKPALLSSFSSNPLPLPNHSRCVYNISLAMHLQLPCVLPCMQR